MYYFLSDSLPNLFSVKEKVKILAKNYFFKLTVEDYAYLKLLIQELLNLLNNDYFIIGTLAHVRISFKI